MHQMRLCRIATSQFISHLRKSIHLCGRVSRPMDLEFAKSSTDVSSLPPSVDLLDEDDFESTLMLLEQHYPLIASATPTAMAGSELTDLSLNALVDLFPMNEFELQVEQHDTPGPSAHPYACLSPDMKPRASSNRPSLHVKDLGPLTVMIKQEPLTYKDTFEAFDNRLRPSKPTKSPALHCLTIPVTANASIPIQQPSVLLSIAPTLSENNRAAVKANSSAGAVAKTIKAPRQAKQCIHEGCTRRAQSSNRCKTHGGGARCQMQGCDKSSQGGGFCRAHGGGKKCRIPGCSKGTQRLGLCYLHGGIRRCITEGCKKKDRGNGYCISHGGGRRCEAPGCNRSVRKGNYCQLHQNVAEDSSFSIGRSQPLRIP